MAFTREVMEELSRLKVGLNTLKSDLKSTVQELNSKIANISDTVLKVDELCRIVHSGKDQSNNSYKSSNTSDMTSSENFVLGPNHSDFSKPSNNRGHMNSATVYPAVAKHNTDIFLECPEQSILRPSGGRGQGVALATRRGFVEKLLAKVEGTEDDDEDSSDAESVVSVKPTCARAKHSHEAGKLSSVFSSPDLRRGPGREPDHMLRPQPGRVLKAADMPKENEVGCHRQRVEISDLQHRFLLDPNAKGKDRLSLEAGVAIKLAVHKGQTVVVVYGTLEAIGLAVELLASIKREVFSLDSQSSASKVGEGGQKARADMIADKSGAVVQVVLNGGQKTLEIIGMPLGIENALKIIEDSGLF